MELLEKLCLVDLFGKVLELYAMKTAYQNNGRPTVLLADEKCELYCDLSINFALKSLKELSVGERKQSLD